MDPATEWASGWVLFVGISAIAIAIAIVVANVPAVAGDPALSFMLLRKSNLLNYQTIGLILILLLDHSISVYPLCWTIILGYQLL